MKAFLMDGERNEERPDSSVAEERSEEEKPGTQEHRQVRKVNSTGPSAGNNIVDSLECLNVWNNVVLQIIIELLIQEQHQTSKNVSF